MVSIHLLAIIMKLIEPCFGGIDPGTKGSICLIWPNPIKPRMQVFDMPIRDRIGTSRTFHECDEEALTLIMEDYKPKKIYVERVHSMPRDGHVGAFSFGMNFGTIKGVLGGTHTPHIFVDAGRWKAVMGLTSDKQLSKARAKALFPHCSKLFTRPDHAESALICLYGLLEMKIKLPRDIHVLES